MIRSGWTAVSVLALSMCFTPSVSHAEWAGNPYCVTPAFVSGNIPPNLLLMIDNSASMYDLAYSDRGKKHCSVSTGTSCATDADCGASGGTCSVFDRQPYYCYDQTYNNSNTYVGYFPTKDNADPPNPLYYSYDFTNNVFKPSATAFPDGCGTHSGTITKKDTAGNTVCVEYNNDSNKQVVAFVAKGNYLNWLAASKFDVEKGIFTGGKFVTVCSNDTEKPCATNDDCSGGTCGAAGTSFLQPESRGCVGQSYIKDALTADFVNYNAPSTNNTNTQLAVTFAVHGPVNPKNVTAPSAGGQTYIDLYATTTSQKYDYAACQTAVNTISSTTSSNSQVKQDVAACLSGSTQGKCSENTTVACFSTYPDCYVPGRCSTDTTKTCLTGTDCTSGVCNFGYFCEATNGTITNIACRGRCSNDTSKACSNATDCSSGGSCNFSSNPDCPSATYYCDEGNASPYKSGPKTLTTSCLEANKDTNTGCYTQATYWCDWGSEQWMSSAAAPTGYTCSAPLANDPKCYVNNTEQGTCSLKKVSCNTDSDCAKNNNGVCQGFKSQGAHACIQHTPAVDHGICRLIEGATNGTCGGQKDYGTCVFGSTDPLTRTKVNFQQTMQACWQYNRFANNVGGGSDVGVDDLKTMEKQCTDIYNGTANSAAYKTCSNNHAKICTSANEATDCPGGTCQDGPNAISSGSPALICGTDWEGLLYIKSGTTWGRVGSFNDNTTTMGSLKGTGTTASGVVLNNQSVPVPTDCASTDTFSACVKKIYQKFCLASSSPGVTDPTDAPSDTASYDNLPAILNGIGLESQLGTPIASLKAKLVLDTPACTKDSQCGSGKSCSNGVCKPAGLLQQFGGQIRIGAMKFNPYGVGNSTETALPGVKMTKVCSNNTSQICTLDVDCGAGTCTSTVAADSTTTATYKNYDGGRIIYPIGKGVCTTMTTKACTTNAVCSENYDCLNGYCGLKSNTLCTTALTCSGESQACIRDAAGDHNSASLVNTIDGIRGNAWTPFAESFYNALGYFAAVPQTGGKFKSRTGLRINSVNTDSTDFSATATTPPFDFNEILQPSEYRCQQNYILLVTDGSSTADRNSSVNSLATNYASQAQYTAGACTPPAGTMNYGGSSNLPILSWIGNHQDLASFTTGSVTPLYCPDKTTACSATGICPTTNDRSCASYHCSVTTTTSCGGNLTANFGCPTAEVCTRNPRDYVTTYVVFNGADNGSAGVCDAYNLLKKTASNGGTTLSVASDPGALKTALTSIFENIAAKASSGTAASILSNSEGSGANILQAVFYPKKVFSNQTSSNWIGEMQNLWYYVDPMINHSTIREDTNSDRKLNLTQDNVVSLRFDNTDNTTYAHVSTDTNGDGTGDTLEVKEDPDLVNSVWRAGRQLWQRNLTTAPRTIYTPLLSGGTETLFGSVHSGLMKFNYGSSDALPLANGMSQSPNNEPALRSFLQMPDSAAGVKLMKYVHGFDFPNDTTMRSRTVQTTTVKTDAVAAGVTYPAASLDSADYTNNPSRYGIGVWKLGDIVSSTPRIQANGRLNSYGLPAPSGYGDVSYNSFINSDNYRGRGMVYVGANDGMLHAFKLGLLDVTATGYQKATLSGSGLGEEQWAYIPKHALPYLNYYSDPLYNHIYSVDGTTVIVDASIGDITGCAANTYDTCLKSPIVVADPSTNNTLDDTKNTWRTVLIGGTGLGGASAKTCAADANCVQTPITDASDNGVGYSSYYALDITEPTQPKLLWEFTNTALGYATSGPAIIRVGPSNKNGRWFAVFGSGPTGKIDTDSHQFLGRSDQPLKFFAVDLRTGVVTELDDPHIDNAFAGSMVGGAIDSDRWNTTVTGHYQDDAILVGYTAKASGGDWTDGGVLRITTKEDTNPANWKISPVITGVGPVTTAISRLQDRKNRALWLYFGTGRYYSRSGTAIDDYSTRRAIFGIKDPCYNKGGIGNAYDKTCTDTVSSANVTNQSNSISAVGSGGWRIDLDIATDNYGAERVVTDAVALTNGTVFITSFEPTADICGFGGNSYLWALAYNTGDRPSNAALAGKALIQLSTGEFKEVNLSEAFGSDAARLMRRTNIPMTGKPPADAFPVVSKSSNRPVKKIMHIQER
jgi:type IV pilus assembly protein PilY1